MRHRVAGIDRQVQDDLLQLAEIGPHRADVPREDRAEIDILADQPMQHPVHVRHDAIDAEHAWGEDLLPAKGQQLPRQIGSS